MYRLTTPQVGMGVTFLHYSDRSSGTIVEVRTPSKIIVKPDLSVRLGTNGMSESQKYEHMFQEDAVPITIRRRKNGRWVASKGHPMAGTPVIVGEREHYHDFSF